MRTALWTALASLGLLAGQAPKATAQVAPEIRSAEALAARIEAAEQSPMLAAGLEEEVDLAAVEAELDVVERYLASHPQDVTARLLAVRLGRVRDLLAFQEGYMALFEDPSAGEPQLPSHAGRLEVLDEILARDSTVAAAHYWKARLLVEEEAWQTGSLSQMTVAPVISEEGVAMALTGARSAVAHEPSSARYREFLAMLLVADDRIPDAVEALDHPSTARGLMSLLVRDLVAFAPPPSAGTDPLLTSFLGMVTLMGAADSGVPDQALHLELRARGWSTTAPMEDVERFYQGRWPGLRFFPAEGWDGGSATAFVMEEGRWRAVASEEEYEAEDRASRGNVILLILPPPVYDQLRQTSAARGVPEEAVPPGDRVGILLMNGRRDPGGVSAGG